MKLIILGYHGDRNIWPQPTLENTEFLPLAPIRTRLLPTNCLSVFDHFVGLALNKLWSINPFLRLAKPIPGYSFSKNFCNFTCHLRVIWLSPDITILTSAEKKSVFLSQMYVFKKKIELNVFLILILLTKQTWKVIGQCN